MGFAPDPVYPLLPTPLKGAGGRAITFRRLDWAPDDLVEASRWAGVRNTRAWEEVELRQSLLNHSVLQQGCELVYEFQRTIHKRDTNKFADSLQACEKSNIPEFVNLAAGMKKDHDAIKAALSSQWSNGQTEGQVNRLKLIKGQMYGRANFDLLTSRFLHPP